MLRGYGHARHSTSKHGSQPASKFSSKIGGHFSGWSRVGIHRSLEFFHLRMGCEQETHFKSLGKTQARTQETSLVVRRLQICLATHGMRVQSLVGELRSHGLWNNEVCGPQLEDYMPQAKTPPVMPRRLQEVQIRPKKPNKKKKKTVHSIRKEWRR